MTKLGNIIIATAALAATTAAFAAPRLPAGVPVEKQQLPPGAQPRETIRVACVVDPAIQSITLTRGTSPSKITVSYVIVNNGPGAWASGARQQQATLTLRNGNTGRTYTNTQTLATAAAAGARMGTFSTPVLSEPFDTFEFGGTVDLQIAYDPDIAIDGNKCNDDANPANNRKSLSNAEVSAFLGARERSRTFR